MPNQAINNKNHPIIQEISTRMEDRLIDIKKSFNNRLDITIFNEIKSYNNDEFDLILNNMSLCLVDDIYKELLKNGKALKKDGLLIASTLGAESFKEVKQSFYNAGSKYGHVCLFSDVQTYGSILQQLKFAMPVVDKELITLHYTNFNELWDDVRCLGKLNNHPQKCKGLITAKKWQKAEEYYWNNFATKEGYIPLTLEIIYLTAWRPDKNQQKPLPIGTKAIPISDILK